MTRETDETGGVRTTVRSLWSGTADVLGDRVRARWLCEVAVDLDGPAFLAALDEPVTERMVAHLDAMVARYRSGEPLQYVLGRWAFRHLDLAVDPRVLIPRPETEEVAGAAIDLARGIWERRREVVVVDLGTGSGAIGLSAAHELPLAGTTVWLTDRDADALDVARANLAGLGRRGGGVRLAGGSWFEALPDDVVADVVVANPPYVAAHDPDLDPGVAGWEPAAALFAGPDGLDDIRTIVAGAGARLRDGGWLVLEIGATQAAPVRDLLTLAGFSEVEVRHDAAGRDRIVIGRWSSR